MHRLKSRGVCSHTIFTHTSAQSVVIKKRWHLGWIVWEKTVINESAASPHSCTSLSSWFFFSPSPIPPSALFHLLLTCFLSFLKSPSVFFYSPASLSFWPPLSSLPPLSTSLCAPLPHLLPSLSPLKRLSLSSSPTSIDSLLPLSLTVSQRKSALSIIRLQKEQEGVSVVWKWTEGESKRSVKYEVKGFNDHSEKRVHSN